MNLGEYLANIILEAEDQSEQTIALFPGAFKPPHKGHFDVVEKLLKAADQVVVLVSPKMREGVSADESIAVWDLYKPLFDGSVEVRVAAGDSPVHEVYDVVKNNPDTNFIVAFGKGEMGRYKSIEKYPNVKVFDAGAIEGVSATNLRMALAQNNQEEIAKYLPEKISVDQFLQALGKQPKEEKPEEVTPPPTETPAETPPTETSPEQPLQESPPINFEEPPYQDYIAANHRKIEQASAAFNLPIQDMEHAFNGGTEVVLNDDMWDKMENTKSYNMKTLEDAISYSLKIGIDPKPYIDAIKKKEDIPLPLVLQWQQGKYYLVGGEIILSIYRSLGVIPTVLLGTLNLQTKTLPEPIHEGKGDTVDVGKMKLKDEQIDLVKQFLKFAVKELKLTQLPSGLTLSYDNEKARTRHTFGIFNPNNNKIWLYVKNRNTADILRTLAHELVHRKQAEEGRIDNGSGETGSPIENEANAKAGVLLRKFGKSNENIYEVKKNLKELGEATDFYPWKLDFEDDIAGDVYYSFDSPKNKYTAAFASLGGNSYDITFGTENPDLDTKEGVPLKVLSTITKITLDFIKRYDPSELVIHPIETKDGSKDDFRRFNLYGVFLRKNLPSNYSLLTLGSNYRVIKK